MRRPRSSLWGASDGEGCREAACSGPVRLIAGAGSRLRGLALSATCALCLAAALSVWTTSDGGLARAAGAARATAASTTCDLNAGPSNLGAEISAARPGQTVCLAAGSYGTVTGAAKAGPAPVTIEPAPGASVDMTVAFNGASNLVVTGVTLDNATVQGATHDVTLSYSTVVSSGQIAIYPDQMTSASNIVIDHDTLVNQSCGTGLQGRIDVQDVGPNNSNPVGLTISNNYLSGGSADGVHLDAGSGIQVLNNTFTQFGDQGSCHTDAIQIYGSASHIIMKGNFFYDQQNTAGCSLGMWDGGDHNLFEDNVVAGNPNSGCYAAVDLLDDNASTVIHNVFAYGGCLPHGLPSNPCGEVMLGGKSSQGAGSGTLIRDNIMTDFANGDGGLNSTFSEDHNLCRNGCGRTVGDTGPSTGDLKGVPQFVGGPTPSTFDGFQLAPGSPGVGAASDGTNIGLELPPTGAGTPAGGPGVGGAGGVAGGGNNGIDALVRVKLTLHRIRRGGRVTFLITLRVPASVTINLMRVVSRPARGKAHRRFRVQPVASLVFHGRAGLNRFRISKVHGHTLKPGVYKARIAAGGKPRWVTFTVVA
jgi:hypothetical protein